MRNKVLALATVAASLTSALNAVTVYSDDTKNLEISGRVKGYFETGKDVEHLTYNNGSSRIRLSGSNQLSNGLTLLGLTEWGYDVAANGKGNFISHRLSYAGVKGSFGSVTMGRQWATYYNVSSYTDEFEYAGGDANLTYADGDSGGISGLGRANDALKYSGQFGAIKVSLMGQAERNNGNTYAGTRTRDYGAGVSLEYKVEGFSAGVASHLTRNDVYSIVDGVTETNPKFDNVETTSTVAGFKTILFNKSLFLAATGSFHTNTFDVATQSVAGSEGNDLADSVIGAEAMIAFFYDTELQSGFYAGYNYATAKYTRATNNTTYDGNAFNYIEVGVRHVVMANTFVFMSYKQDLRADADLLLYEGNSDYRSKGYAKADNKFAVGGRYEF